LSGFAQLHPMHCLLSSLMPCQQTGKSLGIYCKHL
jgi:hypothetical protein